MNDGAFLFEAGNRWSTGFSLLAKPDSLKAGLQPLGQAKPEALI